MTSPRPTFVVAAVVAVALVVPVVATIFLARGGAPSPSPAPTAPVFGDGRASEAHGVRLTELQLPERAGVRGTVRFEILDQSGQPVTAMLREQEQRLHLYIVRDDYSVFRHLYPRQTDGTWSAPLTLPIGGRYRAIAEFTVNADQSRATTHGTANHRDHIYVAGQSAVSGTDGTPPQLGAKHGPVAVSIRNTTGALDRGTFSVRIARTRPDAPAHVIAFHELTGMVARPRPVGKPRFADGSTTLTLSTAGMRLKGPYVFFIQLRADDRMHTLRLVQRVS